ncbi:hypothetical protein DFH28DRAFT_1107806 [Melampsora americana]|nr:hypothetical protein DFH28DRAFT_1107806 [Melampsora americana]
MSSISDRTLRSRKTQSKTDEPVVPSTSNLQKSSSQPRPSDYNAPIFKLGIVSISMAILPIATYYGTLGRVFEANNTTAAAIAAIVVTNIILIGYVILAILENDEPKTSSSSSDSKSD